jgi:rRNA maturation RNase YbeY
MPVHFFKDGVSTKFFRRKKLLSVIALLSTVEHRSIVDVNVILVSDETLLKMNRLFLSHDFYTDIITFPHASVRSGQISGDLYISVDRVSENADDHNVRFNDELSRVIIHGILHLCEYGDKTAKAKAVMRKKEDFYLDAMRSL